jgi:hypothetical protein
MNEQPGCEGVANRPRTLQHGTSPSSFALLVDADNTAVESFPEIVQKAETWGILTLRRVYGNQETLVGQKWKDLCLRYALQPMLHLEISGVKNATDIALVVDAIDLFHTQAIRRFCLVTGDQGFTALILRLRSHGCQVYCIGKSSKANALARVCTDFFPLENIGESALSVETPLVQPEASAQKTKAKSVLPVPKTKPKTKQPQPKKQAGNKPLFDSALTVLLTQAATDLVREKKLEWIPMALLGGRLHQIDAKFTAKTYGQKSLPELCKARTDLFESRPKGNHLEVRLKIPME